MPTDAMTWVRYGVLAAVAVVVALGLAAMAVQRRALNPFSRFARLIRRLSDPLLRPVEARLVQSGGNPQSAPSVLIGVALVAGIVLISVASWAVGEGVRVRVAGAIGPQMILYLAVSWAFKLLEFAIFVRVIVSWLGVSERIALMRPIVWLTEWLLGPLRRIIPPIGMFDVSPMVAWIAVWLVGGLVLGRL